jgi:hypothetical protein
MTPRYRVVTWERDDVRHGERNYKEDMMAWQVGAVESTEITQSVIGAYGFNIVDARNRPVVAFGYLSEAEATKARELVAKALKTTAHIRAHAL